MTDLLNNSINLKDFPEHKLGNRVKLSFKWIGEKTGKLLDGGCSYGYGTRFLAEKAEKAYGMDINDIHIKVASHRYKHIEFQCGVLEHTGYDSEFFDFIVLNDVLEHTTDKIQTLNEMSRILKPGGTIIISTPHRGVFAFLDPYNYGHNMRKYFPRIYKALYKLVRFVKEGKVPEEFNPEHEQKHFHYSLKDYKKMIDSSGFNGCYRIDKVFRSGFLLEVLVMNLESIFNIIFKQRISRSILKPLSILADLDYRIPYGPLAYNIALKIKKL